MAARAAAHAQSIVRAAGPAAAEAMDRAATGPVAVVAGLAAEVARTATMEMAVAHLVTAVAAAVAPHTPRPICRMPMHGWRASCTTAPRSTAKARPETTTQTMVVERLGGNCATAAPARMHARVASTACLAPSTGRRPRPHATSSPSPTLSHLTLALAHDACGRAGGSGGSNGRVVIIHNGQASTFSYVGQSVQTYSI